MDATKNEINRSTATDGKPPVNDITFEGSKFIDAGDIDGMRIALGCITPEARNLLDTIMKEWRKHYESMKEIFPEYEPDCYSFAYWLVRYSGLVRPAH